MTPDVHARRNLDPARPWLEAGRSWTAAADRIAAYDAERRGRRRLWKPAPSFDERKLRARADACLWHAEQLDRLTAQGCIVLHDRIAPHSHNVIDHLVISPAGVVAIQDVPGLDYEPELDPQYGRMPGPLTTDYSTSISAVLAEHIVPALARDDLFAVDFEVTIFGISVLVDRKVATAFNDVLRPVEVVPFIEGQSRYLSPLQ